MVQTIWPLRVTTFNLVWYGLTLLISSIISFCGLTLLGLYFLIECVCSDSTISFHLIMETPFDLHLYAFVLRKIRSFLQKDGQIKLSHTYREDNYGVDYLAFKGHNIHLGMIWFDSPPKHCNKLLWTDFIRALFPRRVCL